MVVDARRPVEADETLVVGLDELGVHSRRDGAGGLGGDVEPAGAQLLGRLVRPQLLVVGAELPGVLRLDPALGLAVLLVGDEALGEEVHHLVDEGRPLDEPEEVALPAEELHQVLAGHGAHLVAAELNRQPVVHQLAHPGDEGVRGRLVDLVARIAQLGQVLLVAHGRAEGVGALGVVRIEVLQGHAPKAVRPPGRADGRQPDGGQHDLVVGDVPVAEELLAQLQLDVALHWILRNELLRRDELLPGLGVAAVEMDGDGQPAHLLQAIVARPQILQARVLGIGAGGNHLLHQVADYAGHRRSPSVGGRSARRAQRMLRGEEEIVHL